MTQLNVNLDKRTWEKRKVSKEEFHNFINNYPRKLIDVDNFFYPIVCYYDFSLDSGLGAVIAFYEDHEGMRLNPSDAGQE
jgi:hypothetical protein